MFTRHLIAAAALMVATCAAHADVISASSLATDMSIVDANTALSGASTGLESMLASTDTAAQLVLVRGVEGLYMLASRATAQTAASSTFVDAAGVAIDPPAASVNAAVTIDPPAAGINAALAIDPPQVSANPVLLAADVPEPSSIALMVAGLLGAAGFMRARKQG